MLTVSSLYFESLLQHIKMKELQFLYAGRQFPDICFIIRKSWITVTYLSITIDESPGFH